MNILMYNKDNDVKEKYKNITNEWQSVIVISCLYT